MISNEKAASVLEGLKLTDDELPIITSTSWYHGIKDDIRESLSLAIETLKSKQEQNNEQKI